MVEIKYGTLAKILLVVMLIPLSFSSAYASTHLDLAKEVVEDYYEFTQEKDVDSYMALFDQNYLNEMYGANNRELFEELFTYFDLIEYELDFQQYTEGPDSLSLFFHLEADSTLNGEQQNIDQDLLAVFSKTNGDVELRFIMLQSVYAEVMVAESTFQSLLRASLEDELDLVKEAIEAGLITEEEIEESMAEKDSFFKLRHLFILIILGSIGYFIYVKREFIMLKEHGRTITKTFSIMASKAKPAVKKVAEKTKKEYKEVVVPNTIKFIHKSKKTYHEKVVPKTKELVFKTKKTYKEKVVPGVRNLKIKIKKKINKE